MIPKRLFFNWIGSTLPDFATRSVEAFRKVNPDFEIRLLVDEREVSEITDGDIGEVKRLVETSDGNIYNKFFHRKWAYKHYDTKSGCMTNINDCLRLYQIDKYGGIYLDLDTFPVRPFDDNLLNNESFFVRFKPIRCDAFFCGCEAHKLDRHIWFDGIKTKRLQFNDIVPIDYLNDMVSLNKVKFNRLREKFLTVGLEYGESVFPRHVIPNYYIDHYASNLWKK